MSNEDARQIGTVHEEAGRRERMQLEHEFMMDEFNNAMGRQCAGEHPRNKPKTCLEKCSKKLRDGALQTNIWKPVEQ